MIEKAVNIFVVYTNFKIMNYYEVRKSMSIYFVRHGESEANVGLIVGMDMPLTEKGKKQAENIRPIIHSIKADEFFSSTKIRAIQTAEIATENKKPITHLHVFDETYFGSFEGANPDDGKDSPSVIPRLAKNPYIIQTEFGGDNFLDRAKEVEQFLLSYPEDRTCLIFAHDSLLRALITYMKTGDIYGMSDLRIHNCEILKFDKMPDQTFHITPRFGE